MPHANIWIRKENWEEWEKLEDKSDLINKLLKEHYKKSKPILKKD